MLRTITSPAFSEVIIIYRDYNFGFVEYPSKSMWHIFRAMSPAEKERQVPDHRTRLKALREMHKVRDFRPILCADVWDCVRGRAVYELEHAVALEREVDDFFSKLSIISIPRESSPLSLERLWCYYDTPWTPL